MNILLLLFATALAAFADNDKAEVSRRLDNAADTLNEIMGISEKGIPQDLMDKAHCIVVVPGMKKGAFIVGAKYGKGFMSCRRNGTGWSAPGAVKIEGGSVGL